jgi:hypothetical protein
VTKLRKLALDLQGAAVLKNVGVNSKTLGITGGSLNCVVVRPLGKSRKLKSDDAVVLACAINACADSRTGLLKSGLLNHVPLAVYVALSLAYDLVIDALVAIANGTLSDINRNPFAIASVGIVSTGLVLAPNVTGSVAKLVEYVTTAIDTLSGVLGLKLTYADAVLEILDGLNPAVSDVISIELSCRNVIVCYNYLEGTRYSYLILIDGECISVGGDAVTLGNSVRIVAKNGKINIDDLAAIALNNNITLCISGRCENVE